MNSINSIRKRKGLPLLLTSTEGKRIQTKEAFEKRRLEIAELLQNKVFGRVPGRPQHMSIKLLYSDPDFAAGKATFSRLELIFTEGETEFSFPITSVIPKLKYKCPVFIHISQSTDVPNKFLPCEEICDRGYAVLSFCFADVASDSNEFKTGCAKYLCKGRRAKSAPGKIALWAWAAMRAIDYVQVLEEIDKDNIALIGHSTLGIAALFAGGLDTRVKYIVANGRGGLGSALSFGKQENLSNMIKKASAALFCPDFASYNSRSLPPFDRHFLLALSVPRHLLLGSAEDDLQSDPENEFLALCAASEAYGIFGLQGLVHESTAPRAKSVLDKGDCCYHIRHGSSYLSREDWAVYMNYIDRIINCERTRDCKAH